MSMDKSMDLQHFAPASRVTIKYGLSVISEDILYDQLLFDDITSSRRHDGSTILSIVRLQHRMKHGHHIESPLFDVLIDKNWSLLCSDL